MESRHTLKSLVRFAKREYKEKRPRVVTVYRVKKETSFSRGILPAFLMTHIGYVRFFIITDYGENLRIYAFNHQGVLLSGENYTSNSKDLEKIKKIGKIEYQIPR